MLLLLGPLACTEPPPATEPAATPDGVTDMRSDPADYADLIGDGIVLPGPDLVLEPYSEMQWCLTGTWSGGDTALAGYRQQHAPIGHHLMLGRHDADPEDFPDGLVADCAMDASVSFPPFRPFLFPEKLEPGADEIPDLPAGVAQHLPDGARWVLQAHYINTTGDPVRVQDFVVLDTIPLDEVVQWAAALVLEGEHFEVPPGEALDWSVACGLDEPFHMAYTGGHMHGSGTAFRVEQVRADGAATPLYERAAWDPAWQNVPQFDPVYVDFTPDQSVRATCSWFNEGDEPLRFPDEMCVAFSAVYPLEETVLCKDGGG